MKARAIAAAMVLTTAPAHAQRDAVSAGLSPEMAAEAFTRAVLDVCVPAAAGNGVSALPAARNGKVQPTQDAETRRQAGALADETVWDVAAARGVVLVRETSGRCVVSVYGPPVGRTLASLQDATSSQGVAARMWIEGGEPVQFEMFAYTQGRSVRVVAEGANPGAPGHQSRFPVVTATVTTVQ